MTEIFFIAYQFPPLNIGGSFRPLKFVKYFNDFDIKPIIFTLSPSDYPKIYSGKIPDYNLLKDIEHVEKEIIPVRSDELLNTRKNKLLSFIQIYFNLTKGTEHRKWKKHFWASAEKALLTHSPKAIVVSAPPFGIIDLAYKLSKKTGIPLIIDMRDSLSMWVSQPYGSYFHYKMTLLKERRWFNHAKKVIAVTEQMINDWCFVHKKIPKSKYSVISNGYDEIIDRYELSLPPLGDSFTIGYVGSFYYSPEDRELMFKPWYKKHLHRKLHYYPRKEDWLYRSPFFLFKALDFLFKQYPSYRAKIFVKFVGSYPKWLHLMINEFNLSENIIHLGFLPFEKTIDFQKECDVLLATSVKVQNGEDYCIAGKTFDYIASKKPILGFVTSGAQKNFLVNSGVGIICDPDRITESVEMLIEIFQKGIQLNPNMSFLEKFHRKELTKNIADIIHSLY